MSEYDVVSGKVSMQWSSVMKVLLDRSPTPALCLPGLELEVAVDREVWPINYALRGPFYE